MICAMGISWSGGVMMIGMILYFGLTLFDVYLLSPVSCSFILGISLLKTGKCPCYFVSLPLP